MKKIKIGLIVCSIALLSCGSKEKKHTPTVKQEVVKEKTVLAATPPIGTNSFDAYD